MQRHCSCFSRRWKRDDTTGTNSFAADKQATKESNFRLTSDACPVTHNCNLRHYVMEAVRCSHICRVKPKLTRPKVYRRSRFVILIICVLFVERAWHWETQIMSLSVTAVDATVVEWRGVYSAQLLWLAESFVGCEISEKSTLIQKIKRGISSYLHSVWVYSSPISSSKSFEGFFHANYLHEIKHPVCKGLRNVSPREEERSQS